MLHTLKNVRNIFLAVLPIKLSVLINLVNQFFFTEEKNAVYKFIEAMWLLKKSDKKTFNKNLVISAEDEERFQSSNKCWVCNKLFILKITGKYRGSAHWNLYIKEVMTVI